jgi:uncharacterized RDD family membrane protein YckC
MECRYCRAWNDEAEHRCARCGRRLHLAGGRPALEPYPIQTATAPALLEMRESPVPRTATEPPEAPRPVYQRTLFREMPQALPALPEPTVRRPVRSRAARRGRRTYQGQGAFDFTAEPDGGVIYCDAPVALPVHRAMAAGLDSSLVLAAFGIFLVIFHLAGGTVVLNKETIPSFVGVAVLFWALYCLLFCLSGGDTAGYRWTQLRLLNFDGQPPTREQRMVRFGASLLSLLSAGLGLLWALVDEETLTWHDHISETFPTPYGFEAET